MLQPVGRLGWLVAWLLGRLVGWVGWFAGWAWLGLVVRLVVGWAWRSLAAGGRLVGCLVGWLFAWFGWLGRLLACRVGLLVVGWVAGGLVLWWVGGSRGWLVRRSVRLGFVLVPWIVFVLVLCCLIVALVNCSLTGKFQASLGRA